MCSDPPRPAGRPEEWAAVGKRSPSRADREEAEAAFSRPPVPAGSGFPLHNPRTREKNAGLQKRSDSSAPWFCLFT